ncbi:MAG: hypothetical protein RIC56_15085 [Pseudomonadales bacterium]
MAALIYEFARIPKPPTQFRHQRDTMAVVHYVAEEGERVEPGEPLVLLENWWARFELVCRAPGTVAKNLFDAVPGIEVPTDTAVVFLFFDPADLPKVGELFELRHLADVRERPPAR